MVAEEVEKSEVDIFGVESCEEGVASEVGKGGGDGARSVEEGKDGCERKRDEF